MPVRLVIALVSAALAVVAAGAWLWLGRDAPRPAALRTQPTSALYALVDTRQADTRPLTAAEVFTGATQTLGALRREAVEELGDCADALWGVEADGCTQALRATYRGRGWRGSSSSSTSRTGGPPTRWCPPCARTGSSGRRSRSTRPAAVPRSARWGTT
ncbi:hypothetical protein ACFSTC_34835 [Nonomuraea ferruginea]